MSEQPRSRRQTRAAILGHLLQSGGVFRPPLAKAVRLSEASLSRILFDLKAEGLIEEVRRPAPYVGGPTGLVSLDDSVRLAAIELTGQPAERRRRRAFGRTALHRTSAAAENTDRRIRRPGVSRCAAVAAGLDAAAPGPALADRRFGPGPWPVERTRQSDHSL